MATFFESGTWVWIPDEDEVVLPAKAKSAFRLGERATVVMENGTDAIYSNIRTILVSVNPFKPLPLYTRSSLPRPPPCCFQMERYKEGPRGKPPHVFSVGHRAYYEMLGERKPQSVIITGNPGGQIGGLQAGATVHRRPQRGAFRPHGHGGRAVVGQQLLQANPILEAFGNAKTVRNDNSSRFGKLITIKFDPMGAICESTLVSYLLEKSRVVFQMAGERNYHIFYQLVAGADENQALRDKLMLDGCEAFNYLNQSGVTRIEGQVEEVDFDEVRNAMDTLLFTQDTKDTIWSILAAVLHLGNVAFTDKRNPDVDEVAKVANKQTLAFAASLVGCDPKLLTSCLTMRKLSTGNVVVPYKVDEAGHTRDAMTKTLYSLLFEWIIKQINKTLEAGGTSKNGRGRGGGGMSDSIIALLDIFGFESFQTNSFEQLCINYCNEKLNNHFNEHVFKGEIAAYAAEGVVVPNLVFKDNKPILDFIEGKGDGLYSILDEQIMVNGTDAKFLSKVQQMHGSHKHYIMPKRNNCPDPDTRNCFGVVHFAGDVFYNVRDFVEKNKDALHSDVVEALMTSTNVVVAELFDPVAGKRAVKRDGSPARRGSPTPSSRKGAMATRFTIAKQFKGQLDALMSTLNATDPHFIRCMKPNSEKAGDLFVTPMMLEQLRYSGLLEVCTIRKMGFPIRRVFDEFMQRYGCISPSATNIDSLLSDLVQKRILDEMKFAKGHSKVLMKNEQASALDVAREKVLEKYALMLQRLARGFIVRRRLLFMRKVLQGLHDAIAKRSDTLLAKWFAQVVLQEEKKVIHALRRGVEKQDYSTVKGLLAQAEQMGLSGEEVKQAQAMRLRIEGESICRDALTAATANKNLDELNLNLQKASEMGLSGPEVDRAKAVQKELHVSHASLKALRTAVKSKHLESIKTALAGCQSSGISSGMDVEVAQKTMVELEREAHKLSEQQNMKQALVVAANTKMLDSITEAIAKAEAMKFRGQELADAYQAKRDVEEKEKVMEDVQAAMNSKDVVALGRALKEAERLNVDELDELSELQEVRNALNREEKVVEVKARLKEGVMGENLALLNKALEMALELGCQEDSQVVAAQAVQKRLTTCDEARSKTMSSQRALTVKMQSKSGVTREDLDLMEEAMVEAKGAGVNEAASYMVESSILKDRGEKQLEAQNMLTQALASLSKSKMRGTVFYRPRLRFTIEGGGFRTINRYKFVNYPRLRTPSDYSKGSLLHKKREADRMLEWQNTVSNKSLTEIPKEFVKDAVTVRKSLLGYMGDKQMSFPETLAQNILMKGLDKPKVRDEVYLQIMKQLTSNPKPDSTAKGWQVMCMGCSTFLPSMDFENYLLNFILEKCQIEGAEACYAKYCLHTLEGMMSSRTNEGIVPTLEEIQAYKGARPSSRRSSW
ncbi:unnamed protein product [Ectocarpus sp. 6 AP-2014]